MRKILLYICGVINLLFGLLHLSFWSLFNWKEDLALLRPENRGILQMFNVTSLYLLLFASLMTFRLAKQTGPFSFSEKALLLLFAGYYVVRILFGYPFFGFSIEEMIVWFACAVIASCYLVALNTKIELSRNLR